MKRLPLNWKLIKILDFYPFKLFSRFVMRTIERICAIKMVDWLAFCLDFMWLIPHVRSS